MKICFTFVPTVLATLPIRTASQGGSFAFIALQRNYYRAFQLGTVPNCKASFVYENEVQ